MSTATELRDKTPDQLNQLIADTRRTLLDLRFQNASGELENTAGLREARRELARALTVARERALDAGEPAAAATPAEDAQDADASEETETEEQA